MEKIETFAPLKSRWQKLEKKQRTTLVILFILILALPLLLWAALHYQEVRSRAASPPTTPPIIPTPTKPAVGPFGYAASINQAGSAGVLEMPNKPYTIEAWVKLNNFTSANLQPRYLFSHSGGSWAISLVVIGDKYLYNGTQGRVVATIGKGDGTPIVLTTANINDAITTNIWHHIALSVSSTQAQLYIDGTLGASKTSDKELNVLDSGGTYIGAFEENSYGLQQTNFRNELNGLIDELRISNIARYTSSFMPPKLPFASDANTFSLFHFDGNFNDASGRPIPSGANNNITPVGTINFSVNTMVKFTPTPKPTSVPTFSNLSSTLSANQAAFTFSYSGSSSPYIIDMSTYPDMSWDVYLTFGQGSGKPIIVTNPKKWDKYTCGRNFYWTVRSASGIKSSIQSATVICPTPILAP